MIVMKFGGTSVQDAAAITRVCEIVEGKIDRSPIVVVSAMAGVTDTLIRVARAAQRKKPGEAVTLIDRLRERHLQTARELPVTVEREIEERFTKLERIVYSVSERGE